MPSKFGVNSTLYKSLDQGGDYCSEDESASEMQRANDSMLYDYELKSNIDSLSPDETKNAFNEAAVPSKLWSGLFPFQKDGEPI